MLFADGRPAQRLEAAEAHKYLDFIAAHSRLRPALDCAVESAAGGYAVFAGQDNPYSRGIGMGLAGPVRAAELDRFEGFYRSRGLAPGLSLCRLADPTLIALLGERSYRIERFMQTWYRPLPTPRQVEDSDPIPPGVPDWSGAAPRSGMWSARGFGWRTQRWS